MITDFKNFLITCNAYKKKYSKYTTLDLTEQIMLACFVAEGSSAMFTSVRSKHFRLGVRSN